MDRSLDRSMIDPSIGRSINRRSRRPNHMRSHLDALQAMAPVNFRQVARGFHSVAKQASFCVALGTDFQGFGKPKWTPKFDFQAFFSTLFFNAFEHQISVDFWKLRTRQIAILPQENVFDQGTKIAHVAFIFGGQNEENQFKNRISKHIVFKHRV